MPARRTRTRRSTSATRTRRTSRSADAGAAAVLVENLNAVVQENASLRRQNEKLLSLLNRIGGLLADVATPPAANGRRTRGRPAGAASGAAAAPAAAAPVKRTRGKITDPEVLRKRSEALAKARAVRAAKRAAAQKAAS
jgi:hypothetical protein